MFKRTSIPSSVAIFELFNREKNYSQMCDLFKQNCIEMLTLQLYLTIKLLENINLNKCE